MLESQFCWQSMSEFVLTTNKKHNSRKRMGIHLLFLGLLACQILALLFFLPSDEDLYDSQRAEKVAMVVRVYNDSPIGDGSKLHFYDVQVTRVLENKTEFEVNGEITVGCVCWGEKIPVGYSTLYLGPLFPPSATSWRLEDNSGRILGYSHFASSSIRYQWHRLSNAFWRTVRSSTGYRVLSSVAPATYNLKPATCHLSPTT